MVQVNFSLWDSSTFNTSYDTYVITHGYQSSSSSDWVGEMAQEIKERDDTSNIILTDWSDGADSFNYYNAVSNTIDVGEQLADFLITSGANPDTTELIGHSLGAHVSGIAADVYEDQTGKSIDTITGLDPAGPGYESGLSNFFSGKPLDERLDASDADNVVVFHTSETFGYNDELGSLDLYINWDDWFQPGQSNAIGNHGYAHDLYTELLDGQTYTQPGGWVFDYGDLSTLSATQHIET